MRIKEVCNQSGLDIKRDSYLIKKYKSFTINSLLSLLKYHPSIKE